RQMLEEASRQLVESLDYEATLGRLARVAVPWIADWAWVHVLDADGLVRQAAIAHADSSRLERAAELGARYRVRPDGLMHRMLRGELGAQLVPEITGAMLERAATS